MNPIDKLLNSYTMYRVILYGLTFISIMATVLGFLGLLPYGGIALVISLMLFLTFCWSFNTLFAHLYKAPTNVESVYITAYILFLIFAPAQKPIEVLTIILASLIAMASKYVFALNRKHIFNPAAIAAVVLGFSPQTGAPWWVGSLLLLPVTLIVGFLIVRKIRRFSLLISFLFTSLFVMMLVGSQNGVAPLELLTMAFTSWPLIFFGTVMLTEPLTTPPTKKFQIVYGALVGIIFSSQYHIGPVFTTPEVALVIGNIFSYLVSPKEKLFLTLKEKLLIAQDTYEFIFHKNQHINFQPGQYMEWTLPHNPSDDRGNRRYFTIASSPTESEIHLGIRFSNASSSFKKKLSEINGEERIVGSQIAGDFTLPEDTSKKLVFIAGGIGVTPFRSMIKYLIDTKENRDAHMFYCNRSAKDIAYKDLFDNAEKSIGLKTTYILTDKEHVPSDWKGEVGYLNADMITKAIPDYKERVFYLSGPNAMVEGYKKLLHSMGIENSAIITDYFPGF